MKLFTSLWALAHRAWGVTLGLRVSQCWKSRSFHPCFMPKKSKCAKRETLCCLGMVLPGSPSGPELRGAYGGCERGISPHHPMMFAKDQEGCPGAAAGRAVPDPLLSRWVSRRPGLGCPGQAGTAEASWSRFLWWSLAIQV